MSDKNFVFPSGLTSQRARALAKEAKKLNGTQLSCELDLISKKNVNSHGIKQLLSLLMKISQFYI
ncbi:hypothetical protein L2Z10_09475 [Acinetobacter baumannii]|uniref:hypothetical protein n=1 Tax=Acinetobacter baumannii TaxID=470 RepID=UPI001D17C841|nr:hypothetical protein [Acinetobacter baumannii]UMN33197.1 hypothetical protein L2Z10_09475 [Acinetobacter baumannii]